jgi:hypothetical protein
MTVQSYCIYVTEPGMLDSGIPILGYQNFKKQDLCGNTQIPYFSCDLPRRIDNGIVRNRMLVSLRGGGGELGNLKP